MGGSGLLPRSKHNLQWDLTCTRSLHFDLTRRRVFRYHYSPLVSGATWELLLYLHYIFQCWWLEKPSALFLRWHLGNSSLIHW